MDGLEYVPITYPAGPAGEKIEYFIKSKVYPESVLLGGMGKGGTTAICNDILKTNFEYPGAQLCLARARMTDLLDTSVAKLVEIAGQYGKLKKSNNNLTFVFDPIGSRPPTTVFCVATDVPDWKKRFKSLELLRLYPDELNEMPQENYEFMLLRMRQEITHIETGELADIYSKAVANDEGNNWVWQRFIGKPHPSKYEMTLDWVNTNVRERLIPTDKKKFKDRPDALAKRSRIFHLDYGQKKSIRVIGHRFLLDELFVTLEGNKEITFEEFTPALKRFAVYIMPDENWSLNPQSLITYGLVSEGLEDQYRFGKVDILSGLIFTTFNRKTHVIPDHVVPERYPIVVGYDHGTGHPAAAWFGYIDYWGRVVVFDEYFEKDKTISEHVAGLWQLIPREDGSINWIGPNDLHKRDPSTRKTLRQIYANPAPGMRGIPFRLGNDRREIGVEALKSALQLRSPLELGHEPQPNLFIMEKCKNIIHMFENFTWELYFKKTGDDLFDAGRYFIIPATSSTFVRQAMDAYSGRQRYEVPEPKRVPTFGL